MLASGYFLCGHVPTKKLFGAKNDSCNNPMSHPNNFLSGPGFRYIVPLRASGALSRSTPHAQKLPHQKIPCKILVKLKKKSELAIQIIKHNINITRNFK
jgi:hypothetical protein